jgi:TolB-like protein
MTTKRKLAAILSADVVGYSRLMAQDEEATVAALNQSRALFRTAVETRGGRVIDTAGDSVLAEFVSPVEAVKCATEVQHEISRLNASIPEQRRMLFRIGVNLGDVVEQDQTLYGDGVNVAARLQALSEPGGVWIAGTVFDQVEGKLPLVFTSMGEQTVKNIPKPVRAYRIAPEPIPTGHVQSLAMPTGPAIAVLPFTNISGDPKEDYFTDGLTEDIITELARFRDLYVLARNTTFQYKGQAVDVTAVGRKLGVRYVLEGSVRRAGSRVRITAQLISVDTGAHVWAERYDQDMTDIFAVQDEITAKVVGAMTGMSGALHRAERRAAESKSPERLEAYDLVLRATAMPAGSKESYWAMRDLLQRAIALDPSYARAQQEYAWLRLRGWALRQDGASEPFERLLADTIRPAQLDPTDAFAHRTAAWGYFFDHQLDLFEREVELAFQLAPYTADIFAQLGMLVGFTGQWARGAALVEKAHALNAASAAGFYHSTLFYDLYLKGAYRKALEVNRQHPRQQLLETLHKYVMAYAQLGEIETAREYWSKYAAEVPELSVEWIRENVFRRWNFLEADIERFLEGFAKAAPPTPR